MNFVFIFTLTLFHFLFICCGALNELEGTGSGPLTKILCKEIESKEVFAQKALILLIPIYTPWTIIYGIYKFIKWFRKLPEI